MVLCLSNISFGQENTTENNPQYLTDHSLAMDFGVEYEAPSLLTYKAGLIVFHKYKCKSPECERCPNNLCGLTRLQHSYQFSYSPKNDAYGITADINYTYFVLTGNFHSAFNWSPQGQQSFLIAPQVGIDFEAGALLLGPNFYLMDDWERKGVTFGVQLKLYAFTLWD